ncbi:hypothetical protein [Bacillus toyonensis]|uniref:hypothetical protein n=1 Tax=Bacillus toyonensis TaxID=155322 RepID=UPI0021CEE5F0|nr:hypothetical protein [Bacillus toyonensis]
MQLESVRKLNRDMKEYEAHFSDVVENPLDLVIGYRNTCLHVIPIWTVTFWIGSKI